MNTGMILAGGEARRAGGREKYLFLYDGERFIDRLFSTLKSRVDQIVIVTKDDAQSARFSELCCDHKLNKDYDIEIICDINKGMGPIGGFQAGVSVAKGDLIFAVACDMPLVNKDVVSYLFDKSEGFDAVIPIWDNEMIEPLHAVYRRDALNTYMKDHTSLSLRDLIKSVNSRYVNVNELKCFDPKLLTFTNVNHLDDLEQLNAAVATKE